MSSTPLATRAGFTVHPASEARFEDVRTMLGPKNPTSSVCWCLSHRIPAKENRALVGEERADLVRSLTRRRVKPGVLAYDGSEVVGWAAVAPRAELPVARSTRIPQLDDLPVWSIFCVRVRPGNRGRGIARVLVEGAVAYAARCGAPAVEAYPVDNRGAKVDLTMAFVGTRKLFEDAGFAFASTTGAVAGGFPRIVMRKEL